MANRGESKGMSVEVRELNGSAEELWDGYVSRHPEGTLFHTLLWRDAVESVYGHESRYLTAWRDQTLVGVFPLARVRSRLAGNILVSVPYAVYGGTLADDDEVHDALLNRAQKMAVQLRVQWLDIRSKQPQWPQLPVVRKYVTFRKQLPGDPGEVLPALPRKARAAARHARERYGLVASFDDGHLDTVWSLYSQSMRRLASPNYPVEFFRILTERTRSDQAADGQVGHVVQVILCRGEPVAGLLSFIYRGVLMPYFSGCDERFERYHCNNLLYCTAMERGVELGCSEFDFGRSRVDNTGAYDFKRFQGFEPTPLHYQYYVPRGGCEPNLTPNNPRLHLARRLWPKLPLAVTRPLGAWLAKSIPG